MTEFTRTSEFKVGDKVWLTLNILVVKATIKNVDDYWVKQARAEGHDGGVFFYDFDEPIGHSLAADMIDTNMEDAIGSFMAGYTEEEWNEDIRTRRRQLYTLAQYRRDALGKGSHTLASTWSEGKRRHWAAKQYPKKGQRSWVNTAKLEFWK